MSVRSIYNDERNLYEFVKSGSSGIASNGLVLNSPNGITFADGTTQNTATLQGPQGEQGLRGFRGFTGPAGPAGSDANASQWATFPAVEGVDANLKSITNISEMSIYDPVNDRQFLIYPFQAVLQNNAEGFSTSILAPLSGNDNLVFIASGTSAEVSIKTLANAPELRLTSSTSQAVLTSTDLTFDAVLSVASEIRKLRTFQQRQTILYNSPAIYADGAPPVEIPTAIFNQYGYNGFYFINDSNGKKINWYLPPDNTTSMTVGDLAGFYFNFLNLSTTTYGGIPYLSVYTKPTGNNDYRPWYHSKRSFVVSSSFVPATNTTYTAYLDNTLPDLPPHYNSTLIPLEISTVQPFPTGPYDPLEQILFFAFSTNSTTPINGTEFILSSVNITKSTGTQSFQFQKV